MKLGVGRAGLIIVLTGWATFSLLIVYGMWQNSEKITAAHAELAKPPVAPVKTLRFDGVKQGLKIPSWKWLESGGIWEYVSRHQAIDKDYQPELVQIPVAYSTWIADARISNKIKQPLTELFTAAQSARKPLIVTSAYRSSADQQKLYNESLKSRGASYANSYISQPGQSEHQLGLAVDLSSFSDDCKQEFTHCTLKPDTAQWLAAHAHEYGFILRYPEGKEKITGVEHESWHFRYVGVDMAKLVVDSKLTYDEIYAIIMASRNNDK